MSSMEISKLPLNESMDCNSPIQFYAATKSNEIIAHSTAVFISYQLRTDFYVYGPWGLQIWLYTNLQKIF